MKVEVIRRKRDHAGTRRGGGRMGEEKEKTDPKNGSTEVIKRNDQAESMAARGGGMGRNWARKSWAVQRGKKVRG